MLAPVAMLFATLGHQTGCQRDPGNVTWIRARTIERSRRAGSSGGYSPSRRQLRQRAEAHHLQEAVGGHQECRSSTTAEARIVSDQLASEQRVDDTGTVRAANLRDVQHQPGPYQLQAAIAAVHDEAPSVEATDWAQIVALYEVLLQGGANPIVKLNHAAAVGMARGPAAGLALLESLGSDPYLAKDYRLYSVRAHLFEMMGDTPRAVAAYGSAAERAPNLAQQRYLHAQAARLSS